MWKSALRCLVVAGLLKVALLATNIYFNDVKTWSEARAYCREHHIDLSSVGSQEEDYALFAKGGANRRPKAWIGLHREGNDPWKWSGGRKASFFNWANNNNAGEGNRCVAQTERGWRPFDCEGENLHFYCFHMDMVLVKENLTWEAAMEHCRQQQRDLVSLPFGSAMKYFLKISSEAQTARVWTGLRYLADTWVWVDGKESRYEAWGEEETPHCPALKHRCGAVSLEGEHWESWDCADKMNFVCY